MKIAFDSIQSLKNEIKTQILASNVKGIVADKMREAASK